MTRRKLREQLAIVLMKYLAMSARKEETVGKAGHEEFI